MSEEIQKIRERVFRQKPALTIYRVPKPTLLAFKQLAKEEFADDYGMVLKWLMDNFMLQETIIELQERLARVEEQFSKKEEEKEVKTLTGKLVKR